MDDYGQEQRPRNLTDADIEALASRMEDAMVRRFYLNLGRGVFAYVWKVFVLGMIAVAAYGAYKAG